MFVLHYGEKIHVDFMLHIDSSSVSEHQMPVEVYDIYSVIRFEGIFDVTYWRGIMYDIYSILMVTL